MAPRESQYVGELWDEEEEEQIEVTYLEPLDFENEVVHEEETQTNEEEFEDGLDEFRLFEASGSDIDDSISQEYLRQLVIHSINFTEEDLLELGQTFGQTLGNESIMNELESLKNRFLQRNQEQQPSQDT